MPKKNIEEAVMLLGELNIKGRDSILLSQALMKLGLALEELGGKDDNTGNIPENNGGDRPSVG